MKVAFFILYQLARASLFIIKVGKKIITLCRPSQRATLFTRPSHMQTTKTIWFHTDAEGEVIALHDIINRLNTHKNIRIILSATSGRSERFALNTIANVLFFPFGYDSLFASFTALRSLRPDVLIFNANRLHPNLIFLARLFSCKVYGLNTQLAPQEKKKLEQHNRFTAWYYAQIYQFFDHFFSQDKDLITHLAPYSPHTVLANSKVATAWQKRISSQKRPAYTPSRIVLLAGSMHHNEIDHYLSLITALRKEGHSAHLMIAPRYLNDQVSLEEILDTSDLSYCIINDLSLENIDTNIATAIATYDICVIHQMGVLFELCRYADIFYLGATFNPIGGHNVIEPAIWHCPIITGPTLCPTNNQEAYTLEERGGLKRVRNDEELIFETLALLGNHAHRKEMGQHNAAWIEEQRVVFENGFSQFLSRIESL